jgi:hypothetical protein
MEAFYWEACGILGGPHVWHITCIYLVILLYLGISLEGELVETLLAILGGVYLFISWSFGMVKTLIRPYLPWICFVGGCPLTILGFDYFIFLWTTFYFWRLVMEHSPRRNILLLYLSCTLEGALCEPF